MMRSERLQAERIERLYRANFPRYLRVAEAILGEHEAARDAVQEAFVRALRHRRRFRGDGPLEAWVWRIVVNEAQRARTSRPHPYAASVAQGLNGHAAESGGLRAVIAALPERQRLAIFLRYYADLDYAAIGKALEIEQGTVSATLNAAHRNLRRALEEVVK